MGDGVLQIPFFKHEQEAVLFQPPQQAAVRLRPAGDDLVELGVQGGDGALGQILGQLLVVVHHDDGHHRAGADVFVAHLVQLGQIVQIDHAHQGGARLLLHRRAEQAVAAAGQLQLLGALGAARDQPVHADAGEHILQLVIDGGEGQPRQLRESGVAPDHVLIPQLHQHRREGACALAGALQGIGGALQILPDAPVAGPLVTQMHQKRRAGGHQLRPGQQILLHHQRADRKRHHQHIINGPGWPKQPHQLFIHAPRPPYR